jgi:uncharacterized protein (DUF362 family)
VKQRKRSLMVVSVVRLQEPPQSLREAIALCGGLDGVGRDDKILIKPNICLSEWMPPYGVVTTTSVVEGLVRLLVERGCQNISIGEGPVDVFGLSIHKGYRRMGIDTIAKRYGVKLVDLNQGPFRQVDLDGLKVQIAEAAFENDFLINVPVLKTHNQVMVSMGFKNLKGFLSPASKIKFHGTNRLNHLIRLLSEAVRPDLTIIDGTYALESGPDTVLGKAYRTNLMIASRDAYACDVVGATLLGIDPSEVIYLREYAEAHGIPLGAAGIEIRGEENIQALVRKLDWRVNVAEQLFSPAGITGLSVPHPGETFCSRCYAAFGYSLIALVRDNPGSDFGNAAICCGREAIPNGDAQRVILYGDCAAKSNNGLKDVYRVAGCPPKLMDGLFVLWKALLSKPKMVRVMPVRLARLAGMKMGIYTDSLPKWERYRSGEFDPSHFRASR